MMRWPRLWFALLACCAALFGCLHAPCAWGDELVLYRKINEPGAAVLRWRDGVDQTVVVEGIAWGVFEKGWGEYVILNNARVYIDGDTFARHDAGGKLVRVTGKLTIEHRPAAAPTAQGAAHDVTLYRIVGARWTCIDRVERPVMTLAE